MKLKDIMKSKPVIKTNIARFHVNEASKAAKLIET
jgi:hypothetical protein